MCVLFTYFASKRTDELYNLNCVDITHLQKWGSWIR